MALVIQLKTGERVVVGAAVITNRGSQRAHIEIAGDTPVLRESELLREAAATTPCKRFYFTLQAMYLSGDPKQLHEAYFAQLRAIRKAAPSTAAFFKKINEQVKAGRYHKALKETLRLIEHETKLLSKAL